jgi:biopolymer transport protein ExbD
MADPRVDKRNIHTVEISNTGVYALDKQRMPFNELMTRLAAESRTNPNLIVYIRADKDSRYELFAGVLDTCQRNGIKISVRYEPPK